jgi:hypothetical protein
MSLQVRAALGYKVGKAIQYLVPSGVEPGPAVPIHSRNCPQADIGGKNYVCSSCAKAHISLPNLGLFTHAGSNSSFIFVSL